MKFYLYISGFLLFAWLSLFSASRAFAADDSTAEMDTLIRDQMNSVVETEYRATQMHLQSEVNKSRRKVKTLEEQKAEALQRASDKAATATKGEAQFKQFQTLVKNRYVNKKSEFEPAMEISTRDVENINDLFKSYLSSTVFFGRVSAGQAMKKLEQGTEKLDEIIQANTHPTESNNSELQIIGYQMRDEESKIEKAQSLASALGLALDLDGVLSAPEVAVTQKNQAESKPTETLSETPKIKDLAVETKSTKRSPASVKSAPSKAKFKVKPKTSKFKKSSKGNSDE